MLRAVLSKLKCAEQGERRVRVTRGSRIKWEDISNLQSIGEGLVQLGDLGRNAEVDGAVTDLDDETTDEVGVDLLGLISRLIEGV